ncbi:hypothetical protein BWI15_31970 [Kribbella sp. ALI-6-A]|uniref:hypothetical protein n=1 Tax=Kribbella sp. ALI-6-A TaxID=1933817 RepID=UPI00097C1CF2|nr:hypothetical protein [Kribbella sp. ALI-6-A]ONI67713.1 hypothetical protein BWI15_31970 [Kribbella sp. ALI-6-A]
MEATDEWYAEGRYYALTVFSEVSKRDGLGVELEDVAPAPGRGLAMVIFRDDSTGIPVVSTTTYLAVPGEVVTRFTEYALRRLLPEDVPE